jgi:hypothetical protein
MRKTPINHIPIVRLDDMYLYDINIIFIYRLYNNLQRGNQIMLNHSNIIKC